MALVQGVAQMEGFAESLRLLLEEEKYTLSDVAMMFGVSRERIRQLAERYGTENPSSTRGLMCCRVWDDTAHRFYPVSKGEIKRQRTALSVREHHADVERRRADLRRIAVDALRTLAVALDRTPTVLELGYALGIPSENAGYTSRLLTIGNKGASLADLWAKAGLTIRGTGERGPSGAPTRAEVVRKLWELKLGGLK